MRALRKAERQEKEEFLSKRKGLIVIRYNSGRVEVIKLKEDGDTKRRFVDRT